MPNLDLVILGDEPLSLAERAALTDDFSESNLPWKVDLVDWNLIGKEFQEIIGCAYLCITGYLKAIF
ncbi:MAG: hypothetical protein Q4B82_01370 [Alysiella sp.]|uniref:hypothetical protein n=1 Tax=Alysiella sp. TaxID=1872483 RepID=UPI0026DB9586|nr:hypothetical protein [Alysiella sp.]MDO4433216.1 hypothetical protein [Alysiella sp.]